ncbi:MAG: hypothetical protein WA192_00935 [Candidatus Acidiferrales bacterium]
MKYISVLLGGLLLIAVSAGAQSNFASSVSLAAPSFTTFSVTPATPAVPANPISNSTVVLASPAFATPAPPPPAAMPQDVQGVFEKYSWDVYAGYSFLRFYEVPGTVSNMNGVNGSAVYWYRDWLGADAEISATYGSQPGQNSWLIFAGLGPRFRWVGPRGIDLWAHALAGGMYITPQTPYGSQGAPAGMAGVGVDLNAHGRHMALRFAVDGIASRYFNTYQISPKASVGLVYKF